MNKVDIEYNRVLSLLVDKHDRTSTREDRTGVGTTSIFGVQCRYSFEEGFPILTNKKVSFKNIKNELLWFLGNHLKLDEYKDLQRTNIKYLIDNNNHIWNDWCLKYYLEYNNIDIKTYSKEWDDEMQSFIYNMKNDYDFAKKYGTIGSGAYGKQWRDFNGKDQIQYCIDLLKNNPYSRRIKVSAWNPAEIDNCLLPPCHDHFQFYVEDINNEKHLSIMFNMRSNDYFLGNPYNISSYSLLLAMFAHILNMKPLNTIASLGDTHLYSNHIEQAKKQLSRDVIYELPKLEFNSNIKSIDEFQMDDIKLVGYKSHDSIPAPVAV